MLNISSKFSDFEINDQMIKAFTAIDEGKNVFIMGNAGTGKSVSIEIIEDALTSKGKSVALLAPTGVASVRIGGQTIHSFFKLAPVPQTIDELNSHFKQEMFDILPFVDTIIIDEIPMVRSDVFGAIDSLLKKYRLDEAPFGGVQMIIVGDLFQLPPVVKKDTSEEKFLNLTFGSEWFFDTRAYKDGNFNYIEYVKTYRQKDSIFIDMLNRIRKGKHTDDDLLKLNRKRIPLNIFHKKVEQYMYIAMTNQVAIDINNEKLNQLPTEEIYIPSESDYIFENTKLKDSDLMIPRDLVIKEEAQVMILINRMDEGYQNGTIGTLKGIFRSDSGEISSLLIYVPQLSSDIILPKVKTAIYEYVMNNQNKLEKKVVYEYKQFPIKLAWALTVHKTQSATFDSIYIDKGWGAFSPGQTYVALSRCRSFDKIGLKSLITNKDIIVHDRVIQFLREVS